MIYRGESCLYVKLGERPLGLDDFVSLFRLMPFDAVFFIPETASLWWSILALFFRFVLQAL